MNRRSNAITSNYLDETSNKGVHDNDDGYRHDRQIVKFLEYEVLSDGSMSLRSDSFKNSKYKRSNYQYSLRSSYKNLRDKVRKDFYRTFLPIGYPNSVRTEYMQYQICDSIQGLLTYLRGMASTAAILKSSGVGSAEASAISASVSWAMRDGVGMVGGLIFSYTASPYFDAYVKEFRLFADLTNDIALTIDLCLPLIAKDRAMLVTCSALSSVFKSICGMAAGASKSTISAHFALKGNMADINAKEGTQEILVTLAGMILGISYSSWFEHNPMFGIVLFFTLTIAHMLVNYVGVDLLRLRTLNYERAEVVISSAVEKAAIDIISKIYEKDETRVSFDGDIITMKPEETYESLYKSLIKLISSHEVKLGCRVGEHCYSPEYLPVIKFFSKSKYLVDVTTSPRLIVKIFLKRDARLEDEWKGFIHGQLLLLTFSRIHNSNQSISLGQEKDKHFLKILDLSYQWVTYLTSDESLSSPFSLKTLKERGWDCDHLYLGYHQWRIEIQ